MSKIIKKINFYSGIGMRASFGMIMLDLVKKNKNLIVLTSDVSTSAGLDRFKSQHKNNYLEIGTSEQNMIGVAAGLSNDGFQVFTSSFSPFQTLRCLEQIKVNLGYMKIKICMVGLASGLVLGNLGYTHCSIEDIGVLRSIPNLNILSPCDGLELEKCMYSFKSSSNSIYIRLTGGSPLKKIYTKNYEFKIGEPVKVKDGKKPEMIDLLNDERGIPTTVAYDGAIGYDMAYNDETNTVHLVGNWENYEKYNKYLNWRLNEDDFIKQMVPLMVGGESGLIVSQPNSSFQSF